MVILILLILNFFVFTLNNSQLLKKDSNQFETIKISGIQSNLKQDWITRIENRESNLEVYLNLSQKAVDEENPQIIIWPEYVFSHPLQLDIITQSILLEFSQKNNVSIILGSILFDNSKEDKNKRFNTLFIFDKNNISTYNALEPVTLLDKKVVKEDKSNKIVIDNTELGISICYEENFPYISANQVNEFDSKILLTIGNQYYIGNKHGLKLSSLNSNLRAVENNRYLFRLETSGLTTVIDNNGKNIKSIPMNERGILTFEMPKINEKTFYSKYRNNIEVFFILVSILIIITIISKHNKH